MRKYPTNREFRKSFRFNGQLYSLRSIFDTDTTIDFNSDILPLDNIDFNSDILPLSDNIDNIDFNSDILPINDYESEELSEFELELSYSEYA